MPTTITQRTAPPNTPIRARVPRSVNGAVKHGRYTVDSGERVLFTLSDHGVSKLIDVPAELYELAASGLATPDTFIVEPGLHDNDAAELDAIVTDYLQLAALHARVPMTFSRLGVLLESLAE